MLNTANRKLAWVPTLADLNSPTASEANAGVDLTMRVTAADFMLGITSNETITDPAVGDKINTSVPLRANAEGGMNFFRYKDSADDIGWTTFTGMGLQGYLIQRIGQIEDGETQEETDFAPNDQVQVYEAITHDPQIMSPATAGYEKFRQVFSIGRTNERAVIAGP